MALTRMDVRTCVCELVGSGRARELRQRAGLVLREAARRTGVDVATFRRWETGRHVPAGGNLRAYAQFLAGLEASEEVAPSA